MVYCFSFKCVFTLIKYHITYYSNNIDKENYNNNYDDVYSDGNKVRKTLISLSKR
jgi:hypothetical protein